MRYNQGFRFASTKAERVKDAMKKNANLESSPTRIHEGTTYEKIMNLRPRDKSSEIDGDFRY